jgi:hypothetical protein
MMIELKRLEGIGSLKVMKRVEKAIDHRGVSMHALRIVNRVSKMIRL